MCEFFNNNASLFSIHNRQSIHHFLLKNQEDHRNPVSRSPFIISIQHKYFSLRHCEPARRLPLRHCNPVRRLIPRHCEPGSSLPPCHCEPARRLPLRHCEPVSFPGVAIPQMFRQPNVLGAPPYPDTASPCPLSPTGKGFVIPHSVQRPRGKVKQKRKNTRSRLLASIVSCFSADIELAAGFPKASLPGTLMTSIEIQNCFRNSDG